MKHRSGSLPPNKSNEIKFHKNKMRNYSSKFDRIIFVISIHCLIKLYDEQLGSKHVSAFCVSKISKWPSRAKIGPHTATCSSRGFIQIWETSRATSRSIIRPTMTECRKHCEFFYTILIPLFLFIIFHFNMSSMRFVSLPLCRLLPVPFEHCRGGFRGKCQDKGYLRSSLPVNVPPNQETHSIM